MDQDAFNQLDRSISLALVTNPDPILADCNFPISGSFILAKCFLNQLKYVAEEDRHRISVVFIGSTAGLFGEAMHSDYASSKAGLDGLQKSLKNEIVALAPRARINVVNPGWTRTPAVAAKLADPDVVYAALATTPLKKLAEPEDIANQVLSFASWRLSGHVTGQVRSCLPLKQNCFSHSGSAREVLIIASGICRAFTPQAAWKADCSTRRARSRWATR